MHFEPPKSDAGKLTVVIPPMILPDDGLHLLPVWAGHSRTGGMAALTVFLLARGRFRWWWQVMVSNQRRLSRLPGPCSPRRTHLC
jgi:hypothetical protein